MKEFIKNWYICVPFEVDIFLKLSKILYGNVSLSVDKSMIKGDSVLECTNANKNPYMSADMLGLHTEWLGEDIFWSILWIWLYPILFPVSGGQTLLCHTTALLRELPLEILNISFLFSFQGRTSIYPLVVRHPIYGLLCLNFSIYGYNAESQKHDYISFPDIPDATWLFVMLYNLIQKYTVSVEIPRWYCLYLDNFLVLHGRQGFLWERRIKRYLLFI